MSDFENFDGFEGEEQRPEPFTLEQVIEALETMENTGALAAGCIYGLSDLSPKAVQAIAQTWYTLPVERRRHVADFLSEISEYSFDLNYEALAYALLEDEDPQVRVSAIDMTWYVSSEELFHTLANFINDPEPSVRAAALVALGRFIYEAQLEEFDQELGKQAEKLAFAAYDNLDEDLEVRRRALEAISRSDSPRIPSLIEEAYQDVEPLMRASAVFAMGASLDRRWTEFVETELDSHLPEIRFEATRAAGELNLEEVVPQLIALANEEDYEIKLMAVWSLGEIGTNEARRGLQELAEIAQETDDETFIEAVEEALEIAQLIGGSMVSMFDFENDDESDLDDDFEAEEDEFYDDYSSLN